MSEELFDVVNEENQVIGQECRTIVHQTGLWHRGVHVFLFTPEGWLLIQQRNSSQDTSPGTWDCSVSEHLKPGESYFDAAIRGLHEELGLAPISLERILAFRLVYGPNDNEFSEVFAGTIEDDQGVNPGAEVANIAYRELSELETEIHTQPDLFAPWFTKLLRWYLGQPPEFDEVLWMAPHAPARE